MGRVTDFLDFDLRLIEAQRRAAVTKPLSGVPTRLNGKYRVIPPHSNNRAKRKETPDE